MLKIQGSTQQSTSGKCWCNISYRFGAYGLFDDQANEGGKDIHVLVITDHFTWSAQATVTGSQTSKCTAQNLWDKFIVHYRLPGKILTDQGCNFESDLLKALCEIA